MQPILPGPHPPCKDCRDRNAECHAKCEKYLHFAEVRAEWRKQKHMDSAADIARYNKRQEALDKARKLRGKGRKFYGGDD